jgi:hypothetical protein
MIESDNAYYYDNIDPTKFLYSKELEEVLNAELSRETRDDPDIMGYRSELRKAWPLLHINNGNETFHIYINYLENKLYDNKVPI